MAVSSHESLDCAVSSCDGRMRFTAEAMSEARTLSTLHHRVASSFFTRMRRSRTAYRRTNQETRDVTHLSTAVDRNAGHEPQEARVGLRIDHGGIARAAWPEFRAIERPFVKMVDDRHWITYREFNERANHLAHGLRALGVKKGDHVCIVLGNSVEYLAFSYALNENRRGRGLHQYGVSWGTGSLDCST